MYGSGKDYMFEVYRDSEMVIEVPDIIVYGIVIAFALFIFKLSLKETKTK